MLDTVCDLYHGNAVDFAKLKAGGISGVFLKSTQGLGTDPTYQTRTIQARGEGLLTGAYCFGIGSMSGKDQASHFLDVAKPDGKTLLVLDFEHNPSGTSMDWRQAQEFIATVLGAGVNQSQIGLYGNKFDLQNVPAGSSLTKCFLWIAAYKDGLPRLPVDGQGQPLWSDWTFHQYSDGMHPRPLITEGAGHVDRDKFNGDDLQTFWYNSSGFDGVTGSTEGQTT